MVLVYKTNRKKMRFKARPRHIGALRYGPWAVAKLKRYRAMNYALIPPPSNRPEKKYLDLDLTAGVIMDSGAVFATTGRSLGLMPQGTGVGERVGNRIKVLSVWINGVIALGSVPVNSTVKLMIALDKQPGGANPVLNGATVNTQRMFSSTAAVTPYTQLAPENGGRYTVMHQYHKTLHQLFSTSLDQYICKIFYKIPHGGLNIDYAGAGATIASIFENHLFLLFMSNTVNGTSAPNFYGSVRIRYTDV